MLSYVYFGTNDLARAIRFYDATLTPLGMQRCVTNDPEWDRISAGWALDEDGGARELAFWIGTPFNQQPATTGNGSMVAFSARSWQAVDDLDNAALGLALQRARPDCACITPPISTRLTCAIRMATSFARSAVVPLVLTGGSCRPTDQATCCHRARHCSDPCHRPRRCPDPASDPWNSSPLRPMIRGPGLVVAAADVADNAPVRSAPHIAGNAAELPGHAAGSGCPGH